MTTNCICFFLIRNVVAIRSDHRLASNVHIIYQFIQLINIDRILCLSNGHSQLSVRHSLRKVLLNVIFHPVPNLLNEIKIWRVWWPEDLWHLASLNFSLRQPPLMTWRAILHELKLGMLLKPVIKHRDDMLDIGFHIDTAPILLPEYTRSFCCSIKTSPKHPTCTTSAFSHYGSWIQFLTLSNTDPYSPMYFL